MKLPGRCEEASMLSLALYMPCNAPAVHIVGWKGRSEAPIRMCEMCTDHNVRNRGGEIKDGDTLGRVKAALIKSGYDPEGVLSAKFVKTNEIGDEVHVITFLDDEGKPDGGNIYIDKDGKGEF